MPDEARDEGRRAVAARGLTPAAVAHLTRDALGRIELSALAPVKGLLKRFFSAEPWSAADDAALAELVGGGAGWWEHPLDGGFVLAFGWRDGAFRLDVVPPAGGEEPAPPAPAAESGTQDLQDMEETFAGTVIPEATPNPRTIRFGTGWIQAGPSRWYEAAEAVDDPRVARLFAEFATDVDNVLVGTDFVAVGVRRPDRWEHVLVPILRAVSAEFVPSAPPLSDARTPPTTAARSSASSRDASPTPRAPSTAGSHRGALDQAWRELGALRPENPDDLARIVEAVSAPDAPARQVTARLLVGADIEEAVPAWARLLDDPSRGVRRAVVDAMVDDARPALRPLLESALRDPDAWTRWKALRGLADLGIGPSRAAVAPLTEDPDFRVRLEVGSALRRG